MTWDKLVDRCLLFTDAPGGLLKELLKEAESELSNKLELYDAIYTIEVPNTIKGLGVYSADAGSDSSYTKLPADYLKDISVIHRGSRLKKVSEFEMHRQTDGTMTGGSPTSYSISGDFIVFNREPSAGEKFTLHYKSSLTEYTTDKVLNVYHYDAIAGDSNDRIFLDTPLGDKLNTYQIWWEIANYTLSAGTTVGTSVPGIPDIWYGNKSKNLLNSINYGEIAHLSRYQLNNDFGSEIGTSSADADTQNSIGSLVRVVNYRNIAPLIPDRFHTSLCDYAVALANAKSSPELYNTYWTKWTINMDNLINEAMDRDLIHNIKEEI